VQRFGSDSAAIAKRFGSLLGDCDFFFGCAATAQQFHPWSLSLLLLRRFLLIFLSLLRLLFTSSIHISLTPSLFYLFAQLPINHSHSTLHSPLFTLQSPLHLQCLLSPHSLTSPTLTFSTLHPSARCFLSPSLPSSSRHLFRSPLAISSVLPHSTLLLGFPFQNHFLSSPSSSPSSFSFPPVGLEVFCSFDSFFCFPSFYCASSSPLLFPPPYYLPLLPSLNSPLATLTPLSALHSSITFQCCSLLTHSPNHLHISHSPHSNLHFTFTFSLTQPISPHSSLDSSISTSISNTCPLFTRHLVTFTIPTLTPLSASHSPLSTLQSPLHLPILALSSLAHQLIQVQISHSLPNSPHSTLRTTLSTLKSPLYLPIPDLSSLAHELTHIYLTHSQPISPHSTLHSSISTSPSNICSLLTHHLTNSLTPPSQFTILHPSAIQRRAALQGRHGV
jgi:hypothetical protein